MMTALGVDLGAKKSGLAVARGGFIWGRGETVGWEDWPKLVAALKEAAEQDRVDKIVFGVPQSPSGDKAKEYRRYIKRLSAEINIPCDEVDETLTSQAARQRVSETKKKVSEHEEAAKIILTDYVARQKS
jgi:putative transcription antitermination factor YqgF